jgi:hypothetical protein
MAAGWHRLASEPGIWVKVVGDEIVRAMLVDSQGCHVWPAP